MKIKSYKSLLWILFITIITVAGYILFLNSPFFKTVYDWSKENTLLFIFLLYTLKTIAIIWPPLPGGTLTLGSIPFLGWEAAYAIDLAGSLSGGVVAYFLGKKYGLPLIKKLFDDNTVEKVKHIKVKKNREIEAVFMYRILLGTTVLELIYYASGFLKIRFANFMIGAALSHLAIGIPTFYFTNNILSGRNVILVVVSLILAFIFIAKFKNRYFE